MCDWGPRKFVFLGRSGVDGTPVRLLIESLVESGDEIKVGRGDVSDFGNVKRAIDRIRCSRWCDPIACTP